MSDLLGIPFGFLLSLMVMKLVLRWRTMGEAMLVIIVELRIMSQLGQWVARHDYR